MERIKNVGLACLYSVLVSGCANHQGYNNSQVNDTLSQATWLKSMNVNMNAWSKDADSWYFSGEPSHFDGFDREAPTSAAVTAMMVRVPQFTHVKIDGPFQVQIYSQHTNHNTVFILGDNALARKAAVVVVGDTLYVSQQKTDEDNPVETNKLKNVIIRIAVQDLTSFIDNGDGRVEGTQLSSSGLELSATGKVNMVLSGNMNVKYIHHAGSGTISLMGVDAPDVDLEINHNGSLNLGGHVGIRSITKTGSGDVHIVGADSDTLNVNSAGTGTTTIAGYVSLKSLVARDKSKVYLFWVNSNGIYANVHDHAEVGLAGSSRNLELAVTDQARFEGKFLRADNVYVNTANISHANVHATQKLFASASGDSSIYFFGAAMVVSRYTMGNGIIIPAWNDENPSSLLPGLNSWSTTSLNSVDAAFSPNRLTLPREKNYPHDYKGIHSASYPIGLPPLAKHSYKTVHHVSSPTGLPPLEKIPYKHANAHVDGFAPPVEKGGHPYVEKAPR